MSSSSPFANEQGYARSDSLIKNAVPLLLFVLLMCCCYIIFVMLLCCGYAVVMLLLLCFCHAVIVPCCCLDGSDNLITVFFYKVPYRQTDKATTRGPIRPKKHVL